MSTTETNRARIIAVWAAMAEGDSAPFAQVMSEGFTWRMMGQTAWSGTYRARPMCAGVC